MYIDSYFLSLIQKWVMHMYLQVRKFAVRSLINRLQISFYLNLRPFQDHLTHIETSQSVGGAKRYCPRKTTWHTRKQNLACPTCDECGAQTHTGHSGGGDRIIKSVEISDLTHSVTGTAITDIAVG